MPTYTFDSNLIVAGDTPISPLGTRVIMPVRVPAFTYDTIIRGKKARVSFEGYGFPDDTALSISSGKNIVRTPVQGRHGTIKELISDGDYEITITGTIVHPNSYPEQGVRQFHRLVKIGAALPIECDLLATISVHHIVITGWSLDEGRGGECSQKFRIAAVSDEPIIDAFIINIL